MKSPCLAWRNLFELVEYYYTAFHSKPIMSTNDALRDKQYRSGDADSMTNHDFALSEFVDISLFVCSESGLLLPGM